VTLATPPYRKILTDHVRTVAVRFKLIDRSAAHTQTDRNTDTQTDTHGTNTISPPFTSFTRRRCFVVEKYWENYAKSHSRMSTGNIISITSA